MSDEPPIYEPDDKPPKKRVVGPVTFDGTTFEPDDKPLIYRKRRACRALDIGMTTLDGMIAAGYLDVVPLGKRAKGVTAASVERVARYGIHHRLKNT